MGEKIKMDRSFKQGSVLIKEYMSVLKYICKKSDVFILALIQIITNYQMLLKNVFYTMYLVHNIRLGNISVSLMPAISAVTMLSVFMYIINYMYNREKNIYICIGFVFWVSGLLVFVLSPEHGLIFIMAATFIESIGIALCRPLLETKWANAIDDEKRAGIISFVSVVMCCTSISVGVVAQFLYITRPVLPFILCTVLIFISLLLFMGVYFKEKKSTGMGLNI